jgi:hypothetical protein
MNEDPYKVVTKLAHKYSHGNEAEYLIVLDELRELMVLQRLNVCLRVKAHDISPELEIHNIRLIRLKEAAK